MPLSNAEKTTWKEVQNTFSRDVADLLLEPLAFPAASGRTALVEETPLETQVRTYAVNHAQSADGDVLIWSKQGIPSNKAALVQWARDPRLQDWVNSIVRFTERALADAQDTMREQQQQTINIAPDVELADLGQELKQLSADHTRQQQQQQQLQSQGGIREYNGIETNPSWWLASRVLAPYLQSLVGPVMCDPSDRKYGLSFQQRQRQGLPTPAELGVYYSIDQSSWLKLLNRACAVLGEIQTLSRARATNDSRLRDAQLLEQRFIEGTIQARQEIEAVRLNLFATGEQVQRVGQQLQERQRSTFANAEQLLPTKTALLGLLGAMDQALKSPALQVPHDNDNRWLTFRRSEWLRELSSTLRPVAAASEQVLQLLWQDAIPPPYASFLLEQLAWIWSCSSAKSSSAQQQQQPAMSPIVERGRRVLREAVESQDADAATRRAVLGVCGLTTPDELKLAVASLEDLTRTVYGRVHRAWERELARPDTQRQLKELIQTAVERQNIDPLAREVARIAQQSQSGGASPQMTTTAVVEFLNSPLSSQFLSEEMQDVEQQEGAAASPSMGEMGAHEFEIPRLLATLQSLDRGVGKLATQTMPQLRRWVDAWSPTQQSSTSPNLRQWLEQAGWSKEEGEIQQFALQWVPGVLGALTVLIAQQLQTLPLWQLRQTLLSPPDSQSWRSLDETIAIARSDATVLKEGIDAFQEILGCPPTLPSEEEQAASKELPEAEAFRRALQFCESPGGAEDEQRAFRARSPLGWFFCETAKSAGQDNVPVRLWLSACNLVGGRGHYADVARFVQRLSGFLTDEWKQKDQQLRQQQKGQPQQKQQEPERSAAQVLEDLVLQQQSAVDALEQEGWEREQREALQLIDPGLFRFLREDGSSAESVAQMLHQQAIHKFEAWDRFRQATQQQLSKQLKGLDELWRRSGATNVADFLPPGFQPLRRGGGGDGTSGPHQLLQLLNDQTTEVLRFVNSAPVTFWRCGDPRHSWLRDLENIRQSELVQEFVFRVAAFCKQITDARTSLETDLNLLEVLAQST